MIRPITYKEAYRELRSKGCWPFVAALVSVIWLITRVEIISVDEESNDH